MQFGCNGRDYIIKITDIRPYVHQTAQTPLSTTFKTFIGPIVNQREIELEKRQKQSCADENILVKLDYSKLLDELPPRLPNTTKNLCPPNSPFLLSHDDETENRIYPTSPIQFWVVHVISFDFEIDPVRGQLRSKGRAREKPILSQIMTHQPLIPQFFRRVKYPNLIPIKETIFSFDHS